jgi:hypothetical protein
MNSLTCASAFLALCTFCPEVQTRGQESEIPPAFHGIALWVQHHQRLFSAIMGDNAEQANALRAELHLSAADIERATAFLTETYAKQDKLREDKRPIDPAEAAEDDEEKLIDVLPKAWTKAHEDRFEELACQLSGPMALRFKHYAAKCGISEKQRVKIKKVVENRVEQSIPLHGRIFTSRSDEEAKEPQEELDKLALELDKEILATLTDKQKAKWKTMLGEKFANWNKVFR